jgi:hypothetical protein
MKRALLVIIFSILTVCLIPEFSNGNYFDNGGKESCKDSSLLIKMENDWAKALIRRDEKMFNAYLSPDFLYTENETLYSRSQVMQVLMSPEETVQQAYNEDLQVHITDKAAIVTGWLYVNGKSGTGSFKRKYRFTDMWYNKNGKWQLIGAQDYLMP